MEGTRDGSTSVNPYILLRMEYSVITRACHFKRQGDKQVERKSM